MWMRLMKWINTDTGASMVEYALLIVLIAIVALVAVALVGDNIAALFQRTASELGNDPVTPGPTLAP